MHDLSANGPLSKILRVLYGRHGPFLLLDCLKTEVQSFLVHADMLLLNILYHKTAEVESCRLVTTCDILMKHDAFTGPFQLRSK